MSKLIAISAAVFGIGLGAWSGYQVGSARSPVSVARADIPTLVRREPGFSAGRAEPDSNVLRALLREEMTAVLAQKGWRNPEARSPGGARTAASSVAEDAGPEKLVQRRAAQEQIDEMMTQGIWGNEQRLSFQQKLVVLDPEQRERALQQITTAINNGTMQVSTDGPPL